MIEDNKDSELIRLQEQIDSEERLRSELSSWRSRCEQASDQARIAGNACKELSRKIEALEGHSLKSLAARLTLRRKKTIVLLREEEAGFSAQCEEALEQQKELEKKVAFYENELLKIKGAKRRLEQIQQDKLNALKETARTRNAKVSLIEEEIRGLQDTAKQLKHALQTAKSAYATAGEILSCLENAEQTGRLDLFGGNLYAGLEKHQQLDRAQNLFSSLSEQVKSFRGELAGIQLTENHSIRINGFLRFSDYAFDGLLTDSIVLNRIKKSYHPILQFRRQMETVIRDLSGRLAAAEEEHSKAEGRLLEVLYSTVPNGSTESDAGAQTPSSPEIPAVSPVFEAAPAVNKQPAIMKNPSQVLSSSENPSEASLAAPGSENWLQASLSIALEPYERRDIPAMIALWNEAAERGISFPREEPLTEITGAAFFAGQSYCGVARERAAEKNSGEIEGFYLLHPDGAGRCCHLCSAAYALSSRSSFPQLWETLIRDCIAQARRLGFRILLSDPFAASNLDAVQQYERMGFQRLGTLPGGFRLKNGQYEDACRYYIRL